MAYFIFLKYLRSLEEFRKNPHVKIPPKSPCANFQTLGKFKNPILIQKSFFFAFGQANLTGPLGLRPSRPRWPLSSYRPKPSSPAHLACASVASLRKYIFPFGSRLPSWSLLSCLSVKRAPAVSPPNSTAPPLPAPPALHLGMPPEPLPPHHHSPP
jgi:hypothetical protein